MLHVSRMRPIRATGVSWILRRLVKPFTGMDSLVITIHWSFTENCHWTKLSLARKSSSLTWTKTLFQFRESLWSNWNAQSYYPCFAFKIWEEPLGNGLYLWSDFSSPWLCTMLSSPQFPVLFHSEQSSCYTNLLFLLSSVQTQLGEQLLLLHNYFQ